MAKVTYADMIKTVSGALKKINKKSPHAADQKMVLATHRVAETTNTKGCSNIYLRDLESVTRRTLPTAAETARRARFAAVAAAVAQRKNDLCLMSNPSAYPLLNTPFQSKRKKMVHLLK